MVHNTAAGIAAAAAKRRAQTHCKRGHEFSPENTYVRPGTTIRACRTCIRDRHVRNNSVKLAKKTRLEIRLNLDPPLVDERYIPEDFKKEVRERLKAVDDFVRGLI